MRDGRRCGVMPAFNALKDEEIAAVLNHIATAWGDDKNVIALLARAEGPGALPRAL